jgi:hypothetical protein
MDCIDETVAAAGRIVDRTTAATYHDRHIGKYHDMSRTCRDGRVRDERRCRRWGLDTP